jgi:DNA-binding CsgD family transcriptional regulator
MEQRSPSIWEKVTFVAFFATLPLYSPNLVFGPEFPGFESVMPWFANATLASALVAGIFIAIRSLQALRAPVFRRFPFASLVAAALYLSGFLLLFFLLVYPSLLVSPLGTLSGVFCGSGATVLCIAWAHLFSSYTLREALLNLGVLCAASAVLNITFTFIAPLPLLLLFLVLIIAGLVSPLYRVHRPLAVDKGEAVLVHEYHPANEPSVPGEEPSQQDAPPGSYRLVLGRLFSVILSPFIGFLLFALTMAVRKVLVFDVLYAEGMGTILAAVIVLPLCFLRSEKPLLPFVYHVFLPIFAGLLIILNSFPLGGLMQTVGQTGVYVFFGVIGLLALASFLAAANAREFPVSLIFGLALASFSAVSLIGLRFRDIAFISDDFETPLLVLSMLYFVYLLLSPGLKAWRSMFVPSKAPTSHAPMDGLETRCEELAQAGSLSKRESEIMLFMGRGYSPAFIAKKLFLSDSTVRSHVKNIYRKLNVNSREDLLQLIDR